MSTADPTPTDPRGILPARTTIPLAILPPPVPPALIRSRAPHPKIPQTKPERASLLEAIRRDLLARPAVPPLRMEELHERARSALSEVGLPEIHLDYAGVLVNNESWRDALAAVPFHRRLLLMPKCLRVESRCPAPFDEFGLLCKSCGLCSIQDFQAEAERLGYAVLVAEGSALVMAMIQTGQIEAIVGVSCLPVLEKTHPFVEAAAIPAVAVECFHKASLVHDDIEDGDLDYIRLEAADASRRVDLGGLRDRVAAWFEPAALDAILGPAEGDAERVARDWLGKAGKRWRPFLAAAVHGALVPEASDDRADVLRRVAVAVECFHKASLVHDDIEDGDLERYGEPTLPGAHGMAVALNAGDVLIGEGYRLLAESGLPADAVAAAVREAARSQRLLCRGQGEELAWSRRPTALASRQVLEIFRLKTAPAFDVALQLGAIAAGMGPADGLADVLHAFSEAVGIAYQIKDDLDDLQEDAGLLPGTQPRPSIVLALAAERARGDDRDLLARLVRGESPEGVDPARVRAAIAECKADEKAALLLESYKEQAVRALDGLESATLKGLLRRVLAKIFDEVKFEGFCREAEQERLRAEARA
jgi:geranylgeranyl diphosphate synthase type II